MKTKENEEGAAFVLRQCFLCATCARGELSAFPFSFSIERRGRFRLRKRPPIILFLSYPLLYFILFLYCAAVCFVRQAAGAFAKRTGNPLGERFKIRTLQAPAVAVQLAAWAAALHKNHSSCLCSTPNSPSQSFCSHRCERWFCECPRPFPRPPATN